MPSCTPVRDTNFHILESKANVLQLRKRDSAVTFFAKTGAALTNSSAFASLKGTAVFHCHTIIATIILFRFESRESRFVLVPLISSPYLDPKMGSVIGEFRCCPHVLCKQICDSAAWISTQTFSLCASQVQLLLHKKQSGTHREKACINTCAVLVRRKSACKTSAGSSKSLISDPTLGLNQNPKTGPKQRPKRSNENLIRFWPHFGVHI